MKGIRTNCVTGKTQEVELQYTITESLGDITLHIVNGVTGYEGFCISTQSPNIKRMCRDGWYANIGAHMVYDSLFIPVEEMRKVLDPYI